MNRVWRLIVVVDEANADLAFVPINVSRSMNRLFDILAVEIFVE